MTVSVTDAGLEIQTVDEITEEIIVSMGAELGLTATQIERVRSSVQSTLGQLARQAGEREAALQEALLAVYSTLSWYTGGAGLDRIVRLLGVVRTPELASRVTGTASGTAATTIENGTRLQYNPEGTIWVVVDGPYTIGGGGTVAIAIESEEGEALSVALDPDVGFDDWTILDSVVGFSDVGGFESTAQPIVGAPIESDAALRSRASVEAFRRGQGPLVAIQAAVQEVDGVTYVRAWDNHTTAWNTVDANLIPRGAINVVVLGGDEDEILQAIFRSRSAGAEIFALVDGTEFSGTVTDEWNFSHTMAANRVADLELWLRITITTSTSEDTAPVDVVDVVEEIALAQAATSFGIGDDVRPYVISGAIFAAGVPGIDGIVVEVSDDGATWQTTKWAVSIRERSVFTGARVSVVEV